MKYLKLCSMLVAIFTFSAHTFTSNPTTSIPQIDCDLFQEFNTTVEDKLKLTEKQTNSILNINETYLIHRKIILQTPNMIGQQTALLATWDEWMDAIHPQLNRIQQRALVMWQDEVNLLGERPW